MNISDLIMLLEQAKDKHGDMPVGAYSADYCHELAKADDTMDIALRVMTAYCHSSATNLPGIDPAENMQENAPSKFLTLFYLDN